MKSMKAISAKILLIGLTLFITGSYTGISQTEQDSDKTLSPYFFIQSDKPGTDQLPLKSTIANVNIAGVIADILVTQVYKNNGTQPIEAIYIFPASTRAAVYGMKMTIGERIIEAKIEKRDKARQDYEQAKQNGYSASLLEQQRPNVFQMNVANIMPGDEIKVELKYTELLIPEDGVYEFVYPTVVGPRYSNTPEKLASADELWVSNPYTREGQLPNYTFDISVNLNAGIPVSDVTCTTHQADINFTGKDKVRVSLKDDEKFGGNRDFILKYKLKGEQIASGLLLYEGREENFFLAMIQPPKQVKPENIPPREYVFIVDVSGSMSGFPLEISKSLLKDLIGNLRNTDKFNVLLFAGGSEMLSDFSLDANQQNIKRAIDFIEKQNGGGGTELLPALRRALDLSGNENYSRTFIIATDGYVTVEKEAFELIRKNLGNANFFPFGIGTSVDRYLIEGMAHVGNGIPFIATSQSDASRMAEKFRKYVSNPVLTNIKIQFNGIEVYDVEPLEIPDVFSERPVLVFGKFRGTPSGFIDLSGKTGGWGINQRIDIEKVSPSLENSAIRSLWAREKIRLLDDYASREQSEELAGEITALGLKYNLLTNYTSFVAIDSQIRNKNGQSITVKQPLPLPQGVSNLAVGGNNYSVMSMGNSSQTRYSAVDCFQEVSAEFKDGKKLVFTITENQPEFIGGDKAFQSFLKANLKYPKEVAEMGISGTVYVELVVNTDGTISEVSIKRSVHTLLDHEAMRVIKMTSGKWKPGMQSGKAVKVRLILPVKFNL